MIRFMAEVGPGGVTIYIYIYIHTYIYICAAPRSTSAGFQSLDFLISCFLRNLEFGNLDYVFTLLSRLWNLET